MALDTRAALPRPTQGEAPFGPGEVFYSRTDPRGVILAGNEVFRRVSDFAWDRLLGAPHRLIRHPDMPKGVFRLLWDRIKAGQPTGAYVKNRARDGLSYWVFAIVTPIPGGYLSVRIRPMNPVFATVQAEYAALLAQEAAGLEPGESARTLLDRVGALGFSGYDHFMAAALAAELAVPARVALRPASPQLAPIAGMLTALRQLLDEKQNLLDEFEGIRAIPMNLHIAASRIETYGGPVATLAESYRLMVAEITGRLTSIVGDAAVGGDGMGERMLAGTAAALFRVGSAQVQAEVVQDSRGPWPADSPVDRTVEVEVLESLASRCAVEAGDSLAAAGRASSQLMAFCEDLKRQMLGLDSIRVLCRVEAGRLNLQGSSLPSIIAQLDTFHAGIGGRLDRVYALALGIRTAAEAALRLRDEARAVSRLRSAPRRQTPAPRPAPPGTSPAGRASA